MATPRFARTHVLQLSAATLRDLEKTPPAKLARPVYSLWRGYWDMGKMPVHQAFFQKHGHDTPHFIHTSGHASREDLRRYATAVRPALLIPIHTQTPAAYARLLPAQDPDDARPPTQVKILANGEWLNLTPSLMQPDGAKHP
jgi:hypothetical protein